MSDTQEKRSPVKYTVLEKSLIGNEIKEAGDVVEYDGLPAENLKPMCEEGKARYQEYLESNNARILKMREQYSESAVAGDAEKFAAAFRDELAKANAEASARQEALMVALQAQIDAQAEATAAAARDRVELVAALQASAEAQVAGKAGLAETVSAAVAAAIAQVFPNGTAKKAEPPKDSIA